MPSNKDPPKEPEPVHLPKQEIVAVSCRARLRNKVGCGGKRSKVVRKQNMGMGGNLIQYVCVSCHRPFQITF